MLAVAPRVGRWPLALTLAAVAACADEPVGPKKLSMPTPNASSALSVAMVTTKSGSKEVGSLRWAVRQPGVTVRFDPALAGDTIELDSTAYMDGAIAIEGPADKGITISGRGFQRVIHVRSSATLRNLTITGGNWEQGSAVFVEYQFGTLTLEHTTVRGNRGQYAVIYGPSVKLTNSTVSGNTAYFYSAGIFYRYLELVSSTVAFNGPAPGIGGPEPAPYQSPSFATLRNSIIASNGTPLRNCKDTTGVYVNGPNVSNDYSCATSAEMIVANPDIGPLANNGGPTMTHRLGFESPAINAGIHCYESVDQRYVPRDAKCDLGAFEFTDFVVPTITVDGNATVDATSGAALITGTIRCNRAATFPLGVQVNQTVKTSKTTTIVVRGSGTTTVDCTTSVQPWSIVAAPWGSSPFQNGNASVTASTSGAPVSVTPTWVDRTVKLIRRR